jgi:hypothetical protein
MCVLFLPCQISTGLGMLFLGLPSPSPFRLRTPRAPYLDGDVLAIDRPCGGECGFGGASSPILKPARSGVELELDIETGLPQGKTHGPSVV